MTVSLTGATGFVGQAVLDVAAQVEEPVRALTRRPQADRKHVEWIAGDLSNPAALARLCDSTDAVIHVAGLTTTPDPADFEEANVTGTERLIAAAKQKKVRRFIFVSSLSAREPDLSVYGASKAKAERLVENSGLDWTIVRPSAFADGPATGSFKEGFGPEEHGLKLTISREDIAAFLTRQVGDLTYLRRAVAISN